MIKPTYKAHITQPVKASKLARESYLKSQVAGLESDMPKARLIKVVRAYHALEQREIAFLSPDYKSEDKSSVYFNFREAVYVLKFGSEEDRRVGKGPCRLDHVSGELHQERRKNVRTLGAIEI